MGEKFCLGSVFFTIPPYKLSTIVWLTLELAGCQVTVYLSSGNKRSFENKDLFLLRLKEVIKPIKFGVNGTTGTPSSASLACKIIYTHGIRPKGTYCWNSQSRSIVELHFIKPRIYSKRGLIQYIWYLTPWSLDSHSHVCI